MSRVMTVLSVLALAGSASATVITPGSIVYTRNTGGINDSSIEFLDYGSLVATQLVDAPGRRLMGMEIDNNGNFYVADAPNPLVFPSVTTIYKFNGATLLGPLGGNPQASFSNVLATGGDLRNPAEAVFDVASNQLLYPNNNQNLQSTPNEVQAVIGVNVTTGATDRVVEDTSANIFDVPNFRQLGGITTDPTGVGNYLFSSPDGGTIVPPGNNQSLTGASIWRLNGTSSPGASASLVVDLASAAVISDLGHHLGFVIAIEAIPGENAVLVTDVGDINGVGSAIYRVDLNPDGTYNSISTLIDQTSFPALAQAGDVAYNPFTGKFVAASLTYGSVVGDFIFEFNPDGTGINILENDVRAGDFIFVSNDIPAPGGVALLGAAGLLGLRRRRA